MTAQPLLRGDSEDQQIYIKHSKLTMLRKQSQFNDLKYRNLGLCGLFAYRETTGHGAQQ